MSVQVGRRGKAYHLLWLYWQLRRPSWGERRHMSILSIYRILKRVGKARRDEAVRDGNR